MTHHIDAILAPILEDRMDKVQRMTEKTDLSEWSQNFWQTTFTRLFNQYKDVIGLESSGKEDNTSSANMYLNDHQ